MTGRCYRYTRPRLYSHLTTQAYTTRPSELYLRKIDAAFERVCEEGARIWYPLGLPDVICGAYQLNVDTGRPETPPDSHWKEVAEGMGVTQQQVGLPDLHGGNVGVHANGEEGGFDLRHEVPYRTVQYSTIVIT